MLVIVGVWLFVLGTVVGSFVNVCVYRIPWQKSVIWPGSHCFTCWNAVAPRDNFPILSWLALRGKCRNCRAPISARYPFVEFLVGILFVGLFVVDVALAPRPWQGEVPAWRFAPCFYHMVLISLLVAGTFIDIDLTVIPDEVTLTGMIFAIVVGTWLPWIRPVPTGALTHTEGFWAGIVGLLVGGGLTWFVRVSGSLALRREAMGFGDVTLMAMIGAFVGWQAAVLTFFFAPFFGIAHAVWKLGQYIAKALSGRQLSSADREIPFGPYLSMAAVVLVLTWPWLWPSWARGLFESLKDVSRWMLGFG
jgi:leader peptidase (prepilin peptidase)/N-methyltransferase